MKFSIILPTYNRAETYLKDAIDSIVTQTYENWELLIIDNYSNDSTDDLINNYNDHRIKTYKIQNHGNIAKSRNLGISKSSGDYIAFIDSDDFWNIDKLKLSKQHLTLNPNNGLCHSEYWLNTDGSHYIRHYGYKGASYGSLLENGNSLSLSAVIVHANILKALGGFSEEYKHITAEDYELWLKLAKNNYKILFIKDILGTFRNHQESESSNVIKNTKAVCEVIKHHCIQYKMTKRKKNKFFSKANNTAGKLFQLNNKRNIAFRYYIKSLKSNPLQLESYYMILSLLIPYNLILKIKSKINYYKNQ